MRLVCSVLIVNRDAISQGSGSAAGRKIRSTVSVFKKGDDSFLLWCSTKNKLGLKYKLRDNVEKCFNRMVDEGKATLRLSDPKIDIQISEANNANLKRLLNAIKLASKGESLLGKGILSSSGPVQNKVIKKARTRLKVESKKSYPLVKGFPSTLEHLTTESCDLAKFDSRVLKLRHLTFLWLSNNKISELPDGISTMQSLVELDMEGNQLTELPKTFCEPCSKLCKTLRSLKLNDNQIRYLPENIGNLRELHQIHLHRNQLKFLPYEIGKLSNLKIFNASRNQIRILPFTVRQLNLELIDVSGNDFMSVGRPSLINRLKFRSLQDAAADFVLRNRIQYDSRSLTHTCRQHLQRGRKCVFCSTHVFQTYVRIALSINLQEVSQTIIHVGSGWYKNAPVDSFICSEKCFSRLRFNSPVNLDRPEA